MEARTLPLASIFHPKASLRTLKPAEVSIIADSIERIGLEHPITVRARKMVGGDAETWEIVAGRHRYEAVKMLGKPEIACVIFAGDDRDARLWEIAENLHRAELTALERDNHVAEWVRLTEDKLRQVDAVSAPGGRGNKGGVRAAAREIGVSEPDARRAEKVAGLSAEAQEVAREAGLDDNRSALLAAAAEPTKEGQIRSLREKQAKDAERAKKKADRFQQETADTRKANRETDKVIADRRLAAVTDFLGARLDVTELHTLGEMLAGICDPLSRALMREAA